MADPSVIGMVGIGASALGAVTGAMGSAASGAASAQMYQYQAGVARINEQIAKQNAAWERSAGETLAQASGMKTRFEVGSAKTTQAASGIDINSGSATQVRESIQEIGAHDEATIRANAAKRAYGHEVEAVGHEASAAMGEMAATKSKTAGAIGAFSSILGGASSVASKWLQYKSVFGNTSKDGTYDGTAGESAGGEYA